MDVIESLKLHINRYSAHRSHGMPKGRPPIVPRIEALEKRVYDLENAVLELAARNLVPKAEPKLKDYEPQFTTWPKANGS
jgi:hypothetical protein